MTLLQTNNIQVQRSKIQVAVFFNHVSKSVVLTRDQSDK